MMDPKPVGTVYPTKASIPLSDEILNNSICFYSLLRPLLKEAAFPTANLKDDGDYNDYRMSSNSLSDAINENNSLTDRTKNNNHDEEEDDDKQSSFWNMRYLDLIKYKNEYGHCNVPFDWPENRSLALWVKSQRRQYKLKRVGRTSSLTDQRENLLNQVGFGWDSLASRREIRYHNLLKYHETFGNVNVRRDSLDYRGLNAWIKRQKQLCRLYLAGDRRTTMTPERLNKLADLGVIEMIF